MDNADRKRVIAFFDLDHTLMDGANGNVYAMQMVREGYMSRGTLLWVIWYSVLYKMNRLPPPEVYRRVLEIMGRFTVLDMIGMMDRGFELYIVPRLYAEGVELVGEHRDKGHRTVVATAAGEYIAERVRSQLGADDIIATTTPIKGERMTPDIEVPTSFMEGKLEMARDYCEGHGADMADCYFYSDSASDLPLLEAVGHPVMVNPQLEAAARRAGQGMAGATFQGYASFDEVKRPGRVISPQMNHFVSLYEESLLVPDP